MKKFAELHHYVKLSNDMECLGAQFRNNWKPGPKQKLIPNG